MHSIIYLIATRVYSELTLTIKLNTRCIAKKKRGREGADAAALSIAPTISIRLMVSDFKLAVGEFILPISNDSSPVELSHHVLVYQRRFLKRCYCSIKDGIYTFFSSTQ